MNFDTHAIITSIFMAAWGNHAPAEVDGKPVTFEGMAADMRSIHAIASQLAMDVLVYSSELEMPK